MKRILLVTLILFVGICFARPAGAELREFTDFSVEVPPGWTIEREGITVAFISEDSSANMQVTVEPIAHLFKEGITAKELAEAYADELKGSKPEMEDNDPNYYSFTFNSPDGVESEASVIIAGRRFFLITISGKHKDLAGMVESVLLSIM